MKYKIIFRYKRYGLFINSDWRQKVYIARDKNDLLEKINSCVRNYGEFYIIDIKEYQEEEI